MRQEIGGTVMSDPRVGRAPRPRQAARELREATALHRPPPSGSSVPGQPPEGSATAFRGAAKNSEHSQIEADAIALFNLTSESF